ncbi:exopolysaccharide biosynthesis polyprenyl glycosylphosphotransferase [Roseomonas sp. SSH11]|uniref:Exopolysaccharide biosynthesis polyprenyl glycosylphosphotransferase n=1 Tax=Pararoseomonas baculiformis TaxID=2820812 RepID=A0ABS4ADU3_9PROT|nr:exopolysaccharide biosynthesis polyprenyl glycosylphosphotransferase [Pararoseomonas baculiformis]MBP0445141.1 exopolysaccharide biosynthesis polyprenyl glycosylphosphotransferase [Pararoseomonas baculiformis]
MTSFFGHSIRLEILGLFLVEAIAFFLLSYLVLTGGGSRLEVPGQANAALVAALLAISAGLASGVSGLYQPATWLRFGRVLTGSVIAALLLLAVAEMLPPLVLLEPASRLESALAILALFTVAVVMSRLLLLAGTRQGMFRRRILLLQGDGSAASRWPAEDPFLEVIPVPVRNLLEGDTTVLARLQQSRPWMVVADQPDQLPGGLRNSIASQGVPVVDASEFWERRLGRLDIASLPPEWLKSARIHHETRIECALRRVLDLVVGISLLLLTLPLILITAVAIKLETPGPILYRQERVGLNGRRFTLFKLRSMVADAEAGGAPRWATKGDSRVTRVGRIIRLCRIDELPQILNVLRGDMALVGPRPERPAFVAQLEQVIPHYAERAMVKPGVTGWAQVNFPYGSSVEDAREKLAYDLYYVKRRSLFLDLLIVVATVRVVLFQEGSR